MTAPLITDHVYRRMHWVSGKKPGDGCAYAGCGQPADAHQRRVRGRSPGVDGCSIYPDCDPWRGTPGLPCPYTGGTCARNQPDSGSQDRTPPKET